MHPSRLALFSCSYQAPIAGHEGVTVPRDAPWHGDMTAPVPC